MVWHIDVIEHLPTMFKASGSLFSIKKTDHPPKQETQNKYICNCKQVLFCFDLSFKIFQVNIVWNFMLLYIFG